MRSILLKGNRLKENFYATKSMMKPLGLGYQKIGMCQTSACCIIFKMQSWLSVEHVRMLVINPELVEDELLSYIENLDNSQSHLDCKGYSCHQRLLNTWHDIIHMTWWMEWWCTLLMVKPEKHFKIIHPHFH